MAEKVTDPNILAQLGGPVRVTDPAILAQLNGQPSSALDAFKSLGTGVVHGGVGTTADILHAQQSEENQRANSALTYPFNYEPVPNEQPTGAQANAAIDQRFGLHQPQTTAGRYAERAGEFVGNPLSYIGGPEMLAGKAAIAGLSGIGSKAGEDLTKGTVAESFGPFLGAVLGGAFPNTARTAITPLPASASRLRDVAAIEAEGIPLTAGDKTGSRMLRATESELGSGVNEAQRDAFRQAAFNRVGEHVGDRPIEGQGGVVDTMMKRTGQKFDTLTGRNSADMDQKLIADLQDIHKTYNGIPGLYPQETVNSVNGSITRVLDSMQHSGTLTGKEYQTLRSNLRAAAQGASDPQRASALHGVTNALDDAMERTIQRTNPGDAGEFAQARRDYRNALVLERWAGSQNMTPATLAQSAKAVYGKGSYVRGLDDFSDLAESGRRVMAQFPDSGTASRTNIERTLSNLGGAAAHLFGGGAGYAAGAHFGQGVEGLLMGEAAGAFAGRPLARGAVMNPVSQAYLGNQALPSLGYSDPMSARLARALVQTQTNQP